MFIVELVHYLLVKGANYRQQANHGMTVFHYCILHGCDHCMEILCQAAKEDRVPPASPTQRYPLDMSDNEGVTPLMLSCKVNIGSYVRILLNFGANADLRSFRGDSALSFALMNDSVDCVKYLTSFGKFIDARSKFNPHGALFTAAKLNEIAIVRILVRYPSYLTQFITEMVCNPSRAEEIVVEVALREVALSQSQEVIDSLSTLCVKQASVCLKMMFDVCKGKPMRSQYSLAGVAEAAKWCIKLSKVLRNVVIIPELDPYWTQIESLVDQQYHKYQCSMTEQSDGQRTEAESHEEIQKESELTDSAEEKSLPKITPSSTTRLLLSFLEIYVIGHYNFSCHEKEDKEQSLHRLQSLSCLHNRLLLFFTTYKEYLMYSFWICVICSCLVESDPAVYDMLHFFKHSFSLFLQNS